MTADKPSPLVPKLRFPEFQNAADWKTNILETQGSFLSSLTGKAAKDFDTGDAVFIPYMNVFSNTFTNTTDLRSVNVADDESQNAVVKGDVFFTVSSETPEEVGMSSVLLEKIGNCYLNSFCALFRFDEGKSPDPVFLGYLLRSAPAREHLSRGAQGATRYNISRATFRSLPILIPSVPEQKKIADCLGSLDELIAAEGQKLEALRQHKQGLMQQLFPQPSETVPRLRFPEFREEGEWEPSKLGDIANFFKGKRLSKSKLTPDGTSPCIHYGELFTAYPEVISAIHSRTDVQGNLFFSVEDDVLMPTSDVTPNGLAKACCVKLRNVIIGGDILVIRTNKQNINGEFLARYIRHLEQRVLQLVTGTTIFHLYATSLEKLDLRVPTKSEQQKIAACLSSLDNLIAAEDRKLEALRQHKKGLIQQLFPKPETE